MERRNLVFKFVAVALLVTLCPSLSLQVPKDAYHQHLMRVVGWGEGMSDLSQVHTSVSVTFQAFVNTSPLKTTAWEASVSVACLCFYLLENVTPKRFISFSLKSTNGYTFTRLGKAALSPI